MLEETLFRMRVCCPNAAAPLIITGAAIADKTADTLAAVDAETRILNARQHDAPKDKRMNTLTAMDTEVNIIAEPQGKNTAPAIALAAALIIAKYGDAVMAIASADHAISPDDAFERAVNHAVNVAIEHGGLVVFGVKPSRPETGYGYIEIGDPLTADTDASGCAAFKVKRFVEKPNAVDAATFVESGDFLWNSGIFVWKASVISEAFKKYMPDLYNQTMTVADDGFSPEAIDEFYSVCAKESIDYGIMEKAEDVSVVRGEFSWDDLGSWESLGRILGSNNAGTTVDGAAVYENGCCDSLVINKSSTLALTAIGLKNVALVAVDDAVLAIDRSRLPEFKKYLAEIKAGGKFPADLF